MVPAANPSMFSMASTSMLLKKTLSPLTNFEFSDVLAQLINISLLSILILLLMMNSRAMTQALR